MQSSYYWLQRGIDVAAIVGGQGHMLARAHKICLHETTQSQCTRETAAHQGVSATPHFIQQHQAPLPRCPQQQLQACYVAAEGGQVLLQGLTVTNVREDL